MAIISTAGLHRRDDRPFEDMGGDYRIIPGESIAGDLVMTHLSTNFDRTGFQQDWNVVFPLDRLRELASNGFTGSVADFHYSFMGAADPAEMEEAARKLAGLLQGDRVDAVLLVPVWPFCTRAVGALAHYLEEEGLPTTQISLIREHTEIRRTTPDDRRHAAGPAGSDVNSAVSTI